jgi:hypothetical protein
LAACGSDDCLGVQCGFPLAATINVSSSLSGTRVPGAFVFVNGSTQVEPCNQSDTTTCTIYGPAGTYKVRIGAPGLTSVDTSFAFTTPETVACGCQGGTAATINVTLVPASSAN